MLTLFIFFAVMLFGVGRMYMTRGYVDLTVILITSVIMAVVIGGGVLVGYLRKPSVQKLQQSGQWARWQIFLGLATMFLVTLKILTTHTASIGLYVTCLGGVLVALSGAVDLWKKKNKAKGA